MNAEPDKYDLEIAKLTEHPELIKQYWGRCRPLFQFCGSGCLTQIRRGGNWSYTAELTAAIRADERIPKDVADITVADLPVFAEWQRKIDKMGVR